MKHPSYYKCSFTNGKTIECSANHPFMTYDGIVLAKDLSRRSEIYSESGGVFLKKKNLIKKEIWLYDALETSNSVYYTNDVLSHNCSFLGSSNTLVSSTKLSTLAWKQPIKKYDNGLDVYEDPTPGAMYVISADTSEGQGLDYSAFTVINVSETPYKIVAKYYNNRISPMMYPSLIYNVALRYNQAYALIETNSIGMQVAEILHKDLEYVNIFSTTNIGRGGQRISSGFKKNSKMGVKVTKQIKSIGCSNLKSLIETNKLIIEDAEIITELSSFATNYSTYAAEPGCHDDLVMTLVTFSWLINQTLFKDLTDTNIRAKIERENIQNMKEDVMPFGFINDGSDSSSKETFVDADGTVWEYEENDYDFDY